LLHCLVLAPFLGFSQQVPSDLLFLFPFFRFLAAVWVPLFSIPLKDIPVRPPQALFSPKFCTLFSTWSTFRPHEFTFLFPWLFARLNPATGTTLLAQSLQAVPLFFLATPQDSQVRPSPLSALFLAVRDSFLRLEFAAGRIYLAFPTFDRPPSRPYADVFPSAPLPRKPDARPQ